MAMASAAASGRKLVVKLRSRQDSSRAAHGQPQQAQLKEAISAIYASSPTPCTLEELFRWAGGMRWSIAHGGRWPATAHEPPFCVIFAASNLPLVHCPPMFSAVESEVAAQQGGALHTLVAEECQRKAAAEAAALASAVALDSTAFLQHVVNLWEAYSSQLSLIRCAAANEGAWLGLHRVCLAFGVSAAAAASGVVTPVLHAAGRCSSTWTAPTWSTTPARSAFFR